MNRYPGVKPFESSEERIFFGRDQDIGQLFQLILLEKLSVLFGKSGYGKSSLINAGIIPRFLQYSPGSDSYYFPVSIRLGNYIDEESSISPLLKLRKKIEESFPVNPAGDFLGELPESQSLWHVIKRRQNINPQRILLIFDQFEEFFSYPLAQQTIFLQELRELLYTKIPQSIRNTGESISDENYEFLSQQLDVRALFSIRSDRLSLLDRLKQILPAILDNRYELKTLTPANARLAITEPASLATEGLAFDTPPFHYSLPALDTILAKLLESKDDIEAGIEAFELQIICQHVEQQVEAGKVINRNQEGILEITPGDLPEFENIFEAYYKRQIARLPVHEQKAAQVMIEDGLLLLNENDMEEARRLSVDGDALIERYRSQGVNQNLLDTLENAFLLRREPNTTGGYNYEISHDTLIGPIANARRERWIEEARLKAQREAEKAKENARIEERQRLSEKMRQTAERGRRRAIILAAIALLLFFTSAIAFLYAREQTTLAEKKAREAEANLEEFKAAQFERDTLASRWLMLRANEIGSAATIMGISDSEWECEFYNMSRFTLQNNKNLYDMGRQSYIDAQLDSLKKKMEPCK
ncbi:MAG: hypothetical protein J5I94_20865 [Phaeodactylibacter sp.]|nr:hypothetical protein [Phaeodactylibacter sp.]